MFQYENPGFLIDEDLSPELADLATARGFHALAVTRNIKLRSRGDHIIARYAVDNDLILVTNNRVDFERIYQNRELHPGLVFLTTEHPKLRKLVNQKYMMAKALDEVERKNLLQEALLITARTGKVPGEFRLSIERFYLPELANGQN